MSAALPLLAGSPEAGATFDPSREYRYSLWREWERGRERVAFCMLNPSTADEHQLDPTIRRCVGYAQRWGFGSIEIVNAFALRSTDPRGLREHVEPVGGIENDRAIVTAAKRSQFIVCAWGVHAAYLGRHDRVRAILRDIGADTRVLALTKAGLPTHPLYQRSDAEPLCWVA